MCSSTSRLRGVAGLYFARIVQGDRFLTVKLVRL